MHNQKFSTLLASAAILGSSMVGCSGANVEHRPALTASQAPGVGNRVEQALAGKDYARALLQAEELVATMPSDAGYRALLGRAYLANGRYVSARTAFMDGMTLGNRDPRTIVSLALCETGLGNAAGARDLLVSHITDMPAEDYGLAMAMAGDPREGVRALMEAVKQPGATARTRQNLAYAMALAGAWGQARLIAGQDLSAKEAEQRIGQWSQAALIRSEQRVYAMVGVTPRADDAGLPTRLALGSTTAEPVQTASAGDLVSEARTDAADASASTEFPLSDAATAIETAEVQPASPDTIAVAMSFDSVRTSNVPMLHASADPMRDAVRASFQRSQGNGAQALVGRAGMSSIAKLTAPVSDAKASDWVVQLGAYDSEAVAREKWERISRKRAGLGEFHEIHSEFALNGRAFYRLAVRGFGDRASAAALCNSLKADGQACFVRLDDTDSTRMARAQALKSNGQMAARQPAGTTARQVASR